MGGVHTFLVVVLFLTGAVKINGSNNHARLLTPEEGCGFQPPEKMFLTQYNDEWPWMGSLLTSSNNQPLQSKCTATLITSRHALTSANCVSKQPLFVRFGETPKSDRNLFRDYAVTKWMVHTQSKLTELENNIALLYLAQDVEFSDRIRPACLPTKASILNDRVSEIYRLVRQNSFDTTKASVYKPKNYTKLETEFCALIYKVRLLDQTSFCAQGSDTSGNQGDPFVVKVRGPNRTTPMYQIGLDAVRLRMNPGIYLNLYPYVQWINDMISGKPSNIQKPSGPEKIPDDSNSIKIAAPKLLTPNEGCGLQPIPRNPNEIVNHSGNWPWMGVILTYSTVHKQVEIKCSATLITNKHLLTSANCANDRVRYVRMGDPQSFSDYRVMRMEVHPGAKWTEYEDYLAILFLEQKVQFSDQLRPVCLPFKSLNLNELSDKTLYRIYSNNSKISEPTGYNMKRYVIISNKRCGSYNIPPSDSPYCAQPQSDVHAGIEGDPFLHAFSESGKYPIYQVALGAYQMHNNPTVFVSTHPYIGWINDTINGNIRETKNEVILPVLRNHEREFSIFKF